MVAIERILDAERYLDGADAVIFDLDDTLYSEKEYVRSGYRKIAQCFPHVENLEEKLWLAFLRGEKAIDEVFAAEGILEHKEQALQAYRLQVPDIHLYEGVPEMLQRIRLSGKKLGIITDGRPEGQRAKLKALHISVDECIITDELGGIEFRKPNEAAFQLMQERMGISYERMIYVGDNPHKDFAAPMRLGMQCIWFRNADGLYSTN